VAPSPSPPPAITNLTIQQHHNTRGHPEISLLKLTETIGANDEVTESQQSKAKCEIILTVLNEAPNVGCDTHTRYTLAEQ
jgi:hypothetical protein